MTSASLDTERELPATRPRRVVGPALISVVLHGALLSLIARVAVPPPEAAESEERPSVKVVVATRLPPPVLPLDTETPAPEVPAPVTEPPKQPEPAPVPETAPADPVAVQEDIGGEAQPDDAASGGATAAWTPARIRSAIATHATERRNNASAAWLAECFLEQKEHGTRDCERQLQEQDYASASMRAARDASAGAFAGVTRRANEWRMTEQFLRSNALLEELQEAGGVVGALATDRILVNNEYMRYLQGNVLGFQGQDPLWQAMQSGFTADVLGGPRLSLPGSVPFRCGSGKPKFGTTPGGVGVSDIVPCVFEFTGFSIRRPEVPVEQNAFRVVPIVPGSPQSAVPRSPPANPVTP